MVTLVVLTALGIAELLVRLADRAD